MNQAVYLGLLKPGDTIFAMDLSHGGHLTHGAPVSHMGRLFNFARYKTHPSKGGAIDFDEQDGIVAIGQRVGTRAWLRITINDHRVGDRRQCGCRHLERLR